MARKPHLATLIKSTRVLLAEDEQGWRDRLAGALQDTGLTPVVVGDGKAALDNIMAASILNQHFHILVTDNRMPYMWGKEVIQKLVADPKLRNNMSVVLATGGYDEEEFQKLPWYRYLEKLSGQGPQVAQKLQVIVREIIAAGR